MAKHRIHGRVFEVAAQELLLAQPVRSEKTEHDVVQRLDAQSVLEAVALLLKLDDALGPELAETVARNRGAERPRME